MKFIFSAFLVLFVIPAAARVRCEDLLNVAEFPVIKTGNIVNAANWNSWDVLVSYEARECLPSLRQELVEFKGQHLWRFRTTEDICDGGNVAGSIYSEDLKTPIAHIYDSEIYCPPDWDQDMRAR